MTDGERLLTEGVDYVVTGYNNTQPGKAGLTVTACGDYTGVKNISFDIRYSLSRISVTGVPAGTVYTGKAVTPEAVLTDASGYVLQKTKTIRSATGTTGMPERRKSLCGERAFIREASC